jgi:hypothetical protein
MSDLVASDVEDGAVIDIWHVSKGDVFQEVDTRKVLRADDWEVDEEGRRAWEMSYFLVIDESHWIPKAGYVYESELADHSKYKRLYQKTDVMPSIVKMHVPVDFQRKTWLHGNGVQIEVERGTTGMIKVRAIGEDLSGVHAALSCPYVHETTTDERVGRIVYVKTFTFVTLDRGRPIDADAVLHVSGKM